MTNPEANTNVVMITWNALDFSRAALERLVDTIHHPYALTVVDNGSTDGTRDYLEDLTTGSNCIEYTCIANNENRGPGAAYSQGYEVSRAIGTRYTALCNNDLYFQDHWLSKLEETMDDNPAAGILGTLQPTSGVVYPFAPELDAKQALKRSSGRSVQEEITDYFYGKSFDEGAELMIRANGGGIRNLTTPPDAVPTSCALVRNSAAEKIGFIADPRYEIYGSEDIDLSWEMGKLGYECAIQYDVYIHHFRHRSSSANNLDLEECLRQNNQKFVEKWRYTIATLLGACVEEGVDPGQLMSSEDNDSFLKLRRINSNTGFWQGGKLHI